jgi:release factor glutamine methyltransferase
VRFEPLAALAAGADGLNDLRRLIAAACAHLQPGGTLLLEHGHDQATAVRSLLQQNGIPSPQSWNDLAGIPRVSGGQVSK